MRQLFYIFLVAAVLSGCEDNFEDTHRYSKRITQSKEYPVYLDMSEIGNIRVIAGSPVENPFKILTNDHFYFVGDMLKGVHVYERKAAGVNYLCFIECRYIKDFELADNRLFCNNLTDMVVVDVVNPLEISILHRHKNHFNRFSSYAEHWNIPYVEGKGIVAGVETHELTGLISEKQTNLDFGAYDQLYGNLTTKVLPDNWFSIHPEYDKPYVGMIKLSTDEIYTFGRYNSWAISNYRSGAFSAREEDLWTSPRGKYAPPYYYSNAYPARMFFEDGIIYILGTLNNLSAGYTDCIIYDDNYPVTYPLYFPTFRPVDICYMPQMNAFFVLSGTSIWGVFISVDAVTGISRTYKDYQTPKDAVEIFRAGDKLVTLGNKLSVYSVSEEKISLEREYPGISGKCCIRHGDVLTIANTEGLFLYDISDLENIQLIP
jgi:hypothetical protein